MKYKIKRAVADVEFRLSVRPGDDDEYIIWRGAEGNRTDSRGERPGRVVGGRESRKD